MSSLRNYARSARVGLMAVCSCSLAASLAHAQSTATKTQEQRVAPPRLVNAPVAPEAIYIARGDSVSVLDLNGFGQGTGSIALLSNPRHFFGYKRNPNLGQPGQFPSYAPGSSNRDAGSAGAFTLSTDTQGSTRLLAGIDDAHELALGQPLDLVYNNANINVNVAAKNQLNPFRGLVMPGNTISIAPIPNPPPLLSPEPNPARSIGGQEPTTSDAVTTPPCTVRSAKNKLVNGDPFARNQSGLGVFYTPFPTRFFGPQPPPPSPPPPTPFCPFSSRQQIGHFLYVLDRVQKRVHVVNSNRMTKLASITIGGSTSRLTDMAMAPHLKLLAVADAGMNFVHFIDTEPKSASFHTVLGSVRIPGVGSTLAWQPEGEALLVANQPADSITIIDGQNFRIRSIVANSGKYAIGISVSARQFRLGLGTWTWFAYILNADGSLACYESGPAPFGPGRVTDTGLRFAQPSSIHVGATLEPTCFVAHQDATGKAMVSQVETRVDARRVRSWRFRSQLRNIFSGRRIVDIALDEIENKGALEDVVSALYPDLPKVPHSSKGLARLVNRSPVPSWTPRFLFVALADEGGKLDIIDLATGARLRSIKTPDVQRLGHYWRQ